MSSFKKEQVEYVSKLARIHLTDEELALYADQLSHILDYIEQLNKADVEKLEPTFHPLPVHNVFREDQLKESLPIQKVLANAPQKEGRLFKVSRVLPNS